MVLGGIDPTINPEGTLAHGDFVCVGEERDDRRTGGSLGKGGAVSSIGNLVYRDSEGKPVHNPLNPLVENLDALPYPDYRIEEHYPPPGKGRSYDRASSPLASDRRLHLRERIGLPHLGNPWLSPPCAYCGSSVYHGLYPSWGRVRRMSPGRDRRGG